MTDLREAVREAFRRDKDRLAFVSERTQWTFGELGARTRRLAAVLDTLGVGPGDAVGLVLSPRPELFYEMRLATFEHGATLFAIAPTASADNLARTVASVGPRLVVYDADLLPGFSGLLEKALPGARALAAYGPAGEYEGRLARASDSESRNTVAPEALAALGFTSGTTGEPKGVTATRRAVAASSRMMVEILQQTGLMGTGEFFNAMPLFAAGGGMIAPCLQAGLTMRVPDRFDSGRALALLTSERIAATFLTPSMLIDLLDEPLESLDLSSLRLVIYGSAGTPAAKVEEAVRRIGPVLLHGYGMAECLPPVAVLWPEEHGTRGEPAARAALSSAGRPFPGVQVRIESEDGSLLGPGQMGEIAILSPTVTGGYWRDAERTAQALQGGWWHSGDLGFLDAEGRVHVLDRRNDVVVRGGRVISPRRVEEAASDFSAVKEVCLVQRPGSERTVAAVSLRRSVRKEIDRGSFPAALRGFLADRLDPAELPDDVRIFEELPRSVQGKVLKREVRDALSREAG